MTLDFYTANAAERPHVSIYETGTDKVLCEVPIHDTGNDAADVRAAERIAERVLDALKDFDRSSSADGGDAPAFVPPSDLTNVSNRFSVAFTTQLVFDRPLSQAEQKHVLDKLRFALQTQFDGAAGLLPADSAADLTGWSVAPAPARVPVFVGLYDHRHGTTVEVHATREAAEAEKAATARTWWAERTDRSAPDDHTSLTDQEVIVAYFDGHPSETYVIEERQVPLHA
ncbi:hypothetical protein [Azospirillum sp. sgz302134]